jgi:hypothetical protein
MALRYFLRVVSLGQGIVVVPDAKMQEIKKMLRQTHEMAMGLWMGMAKLLKPYSPA